MYICLYYIFIIYVYVHTHISYLHHIGPCGTDRNRIRSSGYEVNGGDFKRLQALKALKASSSNASAEFQQEWMGVVSEWTEGMRLTDAKPMKNHD